jgi:hypothetical protein
VGAGRKGGCRGDEPASCRTGADGGWPIVLQPGADLLSRPTPIFEHRSGRSGRVDVAAAQRVRGQHHRVVRPVVPRPRRGPLAVRCGSAVVHRRARHGRCGRARAGPGCALRGGHALTARKRSLEPGRCASSASLSAASCRWWGSRPGTARQRLLAAGWPSALAGGMLAALAGWVTQPGPVGGTAESITGTPARAFSQGACYCAGDFL